MSQGDIPPELLSQMKRDRELIDEELPELNKRGDRMRQAAAEDTLCGHLRREIHQSRRSLQDLASEAGISTTVLCDFLEGERPLPSDVLDRLAQGAHVTICLTPH